MTGLFVWKEPRKGQKGVIVRECSVLHVRFFQAEIARGFKTPEAVLRRRVMTAGKKLQKLGVREVVLAEWFPFEEQLKKCGLQPISTLPLRRMLAADWVRAALEESQLPTGGAKVGVTAAQLTGQVVRTVTELVLRHRYVLLDVPYGGEELCRRLRREYGVSLLLEPDLKQLEEADVLVAFDRRENLAARNAIVIPLYEESVTMPPLSLPPALEERLPLGVNRTQILAFLQNAGVIRPGVDLTF